MNEPTLLDWTGCYRESHRELVVPEAFAHPAKMSVSLCRRIFAFMEESGMLKPGDVVLDPFGGIGTTGLIGGICGYPVVMVELEEKFVNLAQANIDKNWKVLEKVGVNLPRPQVVQGDSRTLSNLFCQLDAAVMSPPFGDPHTGGGIMKDGYVNAQKRKGTFDLVGQRHYSMDKHSDSNIASLPEGNISAVVTSPPHEDVMSRDRRVRLDERRDGIHQSYGEAQGQIGSLKGGTIDGVVTSPPYEGTRIEGNGDEGSSGLKNEDGSFVRGAEGWEKRKALGSRYGTEAGNIGRAVGETYWEAMRDVYGECYKVLKPGGWMAVVVKDFVRKKERVPLCDNTCRLLEFLGFRIGYRAKAWLVEDQGVSDVFHGATKKKERKSFFRRLAEKKGSPRIDFEEVIFAQRVE